MLVLNSLICDVNLGKIRESQHFHPKKPPKEIFWMKNPTLSDFSQIHPVPSGGADEHGNPSLTFLSRSKAEVLMSHFQHIPLNPKSETLVNSDIPVTVCLQFLWFHLLSFPKWGIIVICQGLVLCVRACACCFWLYHTRNKVRGDRSFPTYVWRGNISETRCLNLDFLKSMQISYRLRQNPTFECLK